MSFDGGEGQKKQKEELPKKLELSDLKIDSQEETEANFLMKQRIFDFWRFVEGKMIEIDTSERYIIFH